MNRRQRVIVIGVVTCVALIAIYPSYSRFGAGRTLLGGIVVAAMLSAFYAWPSRNTLQRTILGAAVGCLTLIAIYLSYSMYGEDKTFFGGLVVAGLLYVVEILLLNKEASASPGIDIGPGEKKMVGPRSSETATVVSGFDTSDRGKVSVRGESWQAVRAPNESGFLPIGTTVQVVQRNGLTLTVSAKTVQ